MKKITVLVLSLFCAVTVANAQEITYVDDPSQGLLINGAGDNCFLSIEGGANMLFSSFDGELGLGDRIGLTGNIAAGKWFTPVFGARGGLDLSILKGATNASGNYKVSSIGDGYYDQKVSHFGPRIDILINFTNWLCGYKADRMYNATVFAGASANFLIADASYAGSAYGMQVGLLNSFAISDNVDFLLELRQDVYQNNTDNAGSQFNFGSNLLVGFAYKFDKTDWSAPIVPVCPEYKYTDAEGDALVARLAAADNKLSEVESQLKEAQARPTEVVSVVEDVNVSTIYFRIGSASLSGVNVNAVKAIAKVMKADTDKKYVVTGWADSYTGSAKWNEKLSQNRANSVAKILKAQGVSSDQYEVKTGGENLTSYGKESASLDRAVTIDTTE